MLSNSYGASGRWEASHPQMNLYWITEERHISYSITAAQRLDVSHIKKSYARLFPIPHYPEKKENNIK